MTSVGTERHRCNGSMGEGTTHPFQNSGRRSCTCQPPRFHPGVFVGMLNSVVRGSGCHRVRAGGSRPRAANVRRIPGSERWDADRILGMRAVPWSPGGCGSEFDIQVGMERPGEVVPRSPGQSADGKQSSEDLPSQSRLRTMGPQRRVPWVPVSENWPREDSKRTVKHVGGELQAC